VSAQDLDFSNEATEQIPCTYDGAPMKIAFNARFLAEMLGVLDSSEVKMEFSSPSRAGILTPVEEEQRRPRYINAGDAGNANTVSGI
jgi:DNA polymerase-3 subunit beta